MSDRVAMVYENKPEKIDHNREEKFRDLRRKDLLGTPKGKIFSALEKLELELYKIYETPKPAHLDWIQENRYWQRQKNAEAFMAELPELRYIIDSEYIGNNSIHLVPFSELQQQLEKSEQYEIEFEGSFSKLASVKSQEAQTWLLYVFPVELV